MQKVKCGGRDIKKYVESMCDFADGGLDNLVVAWHNKACVDLFAGREHLMDDWLPVLLSLAIPTIDGRPICSRTAKILPISKSSWSRWRKPKPS